MKDEIIVVIRTLENIMEDEKIMKIINIHDEYPIARAKEILLVRLGRILVEEALK